MNKMILVDSLDMEELSIFTKYNEAQLLHYFEPEPGVFIAETPMVIERALDRGCEPLLFLVEESALKDEATKRILDECPDVDVYYAPLPVINKLTGFNLTRGVLAAFRRPEVLSLAEAVKNAKRIAVMEEVVNPTNVGAIFRSAAALGIEVVVLTYGSSDPFYRRAARVSMGTVFQVPWVVTEKDEDWVTELKNVGFKICAMALEDNSISIDDPCLKEVDKLAIVLGTEAFGIKPETIGESDYVVKIPMSNNVDSLNVAAASAVAFWELKRN